MYVCVCMYVYIDTHIHTQDIDVCCNTVTKIHDSMKQNCWHDLVKYR